MGSRMFSQRRLCLSEGGLLKVENSPSLEVYKALWFYLLLGMLLQEISKVERGKGAESK